VKQRGLAAADVEDAALVLAKPGGEPGDIAETREQARLFCDHVIPFIEPARRVKFDRGLPDLSACRQRRASGAGPGRTESRPTIEDYRSIIHTQLRLFF
jgi:hypothetical protein